MKFSLIYDTALKLGCEAEYDVPMSSYTSFRTGGNAALMITPSDDKALSEIVSVCCKENIKPFILGNGSNMLVSDNGIDNVVINMCRKSGGIRLIGDATVECDAGVQLSKLCNFALQKSLTGLEFAFGIPGSAGGAAYMNAGAYGGEMKDVLVSCRHINPDGTFGILKGDELKLGYRTSAYESNDKIIVSVTVKLKKGNSEEIKNKMQELLQRRKDKQPLEYASAGSTFKRPEGYFAGALIEECGLKGKSVGDAAVSEKHAGFIINKGQATSDDILKLIKSVQETVYKEKGILLEPEVRLIEK